MTPIQKADLFLQMYGQYYHYYRQMKDELQEPMLNFLICKNVSEVLQKENVDFSIQLFRKRSRHPYPAIVIDDIAWSIEGPLYLSTQELEFDIRRLPSSYSPSDFIEKFNAEYSDYVVQEALKIEQENGLRQSLSFSLNQALEKLPVTLLSIENTNGKNEANLLIQSSDVLNSTLDNSLDSMNSTIASVGDYRYSFHPLEKFKASLDPFCDFFYLSKKSSFTMQEVSDMFYDLKEIPLGNDQLTEVFNSIREIAPNLRENSDTNTASLFFSPSDFSVTDDEFQSNAFHYNFEINSEEDLKKMKEFLISTKNLNFFGIRLSRLFHESEPGLADVITHNVVGNFVTPSNGAHQFQDHFIQLEHLDVALPMLGHFPALLQTLRYHKDIRSIADPLKPKPVHRF